MTRSEASRVRPLATFWAEPTRSWLGLVAWLVVFHVILYLRLPWFVSPTLQAYLVQPLLWLGTAGLAFWLWRRRGQGSLLPADRWLVPLCVLAGALHVAFYVLTGLLRGFGPSPYARAVEQVALNLWFGGARLVGVELARWVLVTTLARRGAWVGIAVGWLLPFLFQVGLWAFAFVGAPQAALSLAARSLVPAAAENALATYLALAGGPLAALTYRGVLVLFAFLAPGLPRLSVLTAALLGVGAPLVSWLVLSARVSAQRSTSPISNRGPRYQRARRAGWPGAQPATAESAWPCLSANGRGAQGVAAQESYTWYTALRLR